MLRRLPLYPVLFAIFPIVALAAYNIDEISIQVIVRPLVFVAVSCLVLFLLARLLLKDWHRAALVLFPILLFVFTYGHIYDLLEDVTVAGASIFRHRTLLPFLGILLLAALYWSVHRIKQPAAYTWWLNLLAIYLLAYPTFTILYEGIQGAMAAPDAQAASSDVVINTDQPDIYYIILDAYGRADVLQRMFGYDNAEFLNALRRRGFYVAECSQTNYATTNFSLASSLNHEYLDTLNVANSRVERTALLRHGAVRRFLEARGYKSVAFPTGWAFTEWEDADLYVDFDHPVSALNEFETLAVNTTVFRMWYDSNVVDTSNATNKDMRRLRVLSLLEKIKRLPKLDESLFVFAHIVVPHRPYTFGPNGEIPAYDGKTATLEETRQAYIDQVEFVSREILDVVDALLTDSDVPPVIIIQGDHGLAADLTSEAAERMPILNAYYLPGISMDEVLYPSVSPVNSFRIVLNSYFGQELPILEDRSYFAPDDLRTDFQLVPNSCSGEQ